MPIYEYVCESCKAKFEKLVRSMNSTEAAECPKCGARRPRTVQLIRGGRWGGLRLGGFSRRGMRLLQRTRLPAPTRECEPK